MNLKRPFQELDIAAKAFQEAPDGEDPLGIDEVDYIEIYCGNARQAAFFYAQAFGFSVDFYRGPETGCAATASYVLRQNKTTLILTSSLEPDSVITKQLALHGDTVHSVALRVPFCDHFYKHAVEHGAVSVTPPKILKDSSGEVRYAAIKSYGDVIHELIQRNDYSGDFLPGFAPAEEILQVPSSSASSDLIRVDHIVGNVELGKMDFWVDFYSKALGFTQMTHFSDEDISTEYSALMSKVMRNGNNKIKFPINEPAKGRRKSQIEEYLDFHRGPGVQHIALLTGDIINTVKRLRDRGVQFLQVPKTYYDSVRERVGEIDEDFDSIAELGILVDRDDDGYLLQLFTRPVQDRPTLFFEIIQRRGSQGFGAGNFKALFEAIEREQERRGNL